MKVKVTIEHKGATLTQTYNSKTLRASTVGKFIHDMIVCLEKYRK